MAGVRCWAKLAAGGCIAGDGMLGPNRDPACRCGWPWERWLLGAGSSRKGSPAKHSSTCVIKTCQLHAGALFPCNQTCCGSAQGDCPRTPANGGKVTRPQLSAMCRARSDSMPSHQARKTLSCLCRRACSVSLVVPRLDTASNACRPCNMLHSIP